MGLAGPADDPLVVLNGGLEDADFPLARIDSLGLEASLHEGTVEIRDSAPPVGVRRGAGARAWFRIREPGWRISGPARIWTWI